MEVRDRIFSSTNIAVTNLFSCYSNNQPKYWSQWREFTWSWIWNELDKSSTSLTFAGRRPGWRLVVALISLLPSTCLITTQAVDSTIGLMQSINHIAVEMIPHRWAVNCSHLWPHFTIVNFSSRMVYIQILRLVATMVGTSLKMWSNDVIYNGYRPL